MRDEQNREYRVEELIGTGGQGDVWRLEGGRGAVKVLRVVDADTGRKLREQLRWIARTDFSGIPLAPPITLLAERPGYAMDLADGMAGLGSLFRPPRGQDQRLWYRDTGGLRRRLLILGRLAEALHRLHSRAIVYGDLSPGNILVAERSDHIMLIDLDNLSTEVDHRRAAVFTPNYGAPEVVTGAAPNDEHSDVFSLALLVFRVLTWTHPLHGEHALADPAMQELADLGELPWVHHPTDDRNRAKPGRGLPLDAVLTPGVRKLCARTFEEGLTDPAARPSADEWRTALLRAADFTVECPGCGITSLATTDTCMWCQTPRAQLLLAGFAAHLPSEGEPVDVKHALVLNQGRSHRIDARRALLVLDHGPGRPATDPDDPVVELRWSGGAEIEALRCGSQPVYLVDRLSSRSIELRVGRTHRVPLDENGWPWNVHFDRVDAPHRLLVFNGVR